MASKRALARQLFSFTKTFSSSRISGMTRIRPSKPCIAPDPGDHGIRRQFLHRRAFASPEISPSAGGNLIEKLRVMNLLTKDRIQLNEMLPPQETKTAPGAFPAITVEDARKLMRASEIEMVKSRLRDIGKNWVSYSEFIRVCGEACSGPEQGNRVADMLDKSGNVIVLGSFVCLKPEELTKAVVAMIPTHKSNEDVGRRRQELEKLRVTKTEIDRKADDMVRRELWMGLGLLMAQTIGFFRLTFWELSWDVMEPICFYVTSTYFMAGYAFFLNTSKEPSFEGFYRSRFEKKQKQLMESRNFDIVRYQELLRIVHPELSGSDRPCFGL